MVKTSLNWILPVTTQHNLTPHPCRMLVHTTGLLQEQVRPNRGALSAVLGSTGWPTVDTSYSCMCFSTEMVPHFLLALHLEYFL